jgi:hypothetical protein
LESVPVTAGGSCAVADADKATTKSTTDTKKSFGCPKRAFVTVAPFVVSFVSFVVSP